MQIIVENLEKNFTVKQKHEKQIIKAVSDVSFNIDKGEIVAFIGPNGAGKSTTIKMLTGIIEPTGGKILVDGLNLGCFLEILFDEQSIFFLLIK